MIQWWALLLYTEEILGLHLSPVISYLDKIQYGFLQYFQVNIWTVS
jgi:hypothetical protein